jgi:hypothetical protein
LVQSEAVNLALKIIAMANIQRRLSVGERTALTRALWQPEE